MEAEPLPNPGNSLAKRAFYRKPLSPFELWLKFLQQGGKAIQKRHRRLSRWRDPASQTSFYLGSRSSRNGLPQPENYRRCSPNGFGNHRLFETARLIYGPASFVRNA